MMPNFLSGPIYLSKAPFIMKEDHLKLYIASAPTNPAWEAVGFGIRKDFYEGLLHAYEKQLAFQMVYHVEINEFRGDRNLQLRILDISEI
jgi:single-stranded-DNA-specific exonuclease